MTRANGDEEPKPAWEWITKHPFRTIVVSFLTVIAAVWILLATLAITSAIPTH